VHSYPGEEARHVHSLVHVLLLFTEGSVITITLKMLKTIFSVCSMLRLNPVLSIPTQECTCQIVSSFLKQNQCLKGHLFPSFISPDVILTQDIPLGLEVLRACFGIIPIGGHVANCLYWRILLQLHMAPICQTLSNCYTMPLSMGFSCFPTWALLYCSERRGDVYALFFGEI
jgi:hypothetical protein